MLHFAPLKNRVVRSTSVGSAISVTPSSHPLCYRHYSEIQLENAVKAVLNDHLSLRRAALLYGVPRSTLSDHITGKILPGAHSGPKSYLSTDEEAELAKFLVRCSMMGYSKSKSEVIALIQRVVNRKGLQVNVTHGWWDSFRKRHPELTLRVPTPLSQARSQATDVEVLSHYFDLLEETIISNDLHGKPHLIFNMDESGMPLDPAPPKLIFRRGAAAAHAVGSGDKTQITVVGCVSASGYCLPPMVIWDRKTLNPELANGEVPGTLYGLSSKGWIDHELFHDWFLHHFLMYAPACRPLLLLLDGHSSHYHPDTIKFAAKERVIVFALPPNTTHLCQPLDKGCFGPLKTAWRSVCHEFYTNNPGKMVTRFNFSRLFNSAWMQSMTVRNITGGFQVTGIYPLDRGIIVGSDHMISSHVPEDTGLAFIPLYSPLRRSKFLPRSDVSMYQVQNDSVVDEGDITESADYNSLVAPNDVWMPNGTVTGISRMLALPEAPRPVKHPTKVSCGRVLTSTENLTALEAKQRKKEEEARQKEMKKLLREQQKKKGNF